MKHIFKPGSKDKPVLLLLHGTGGTEQDLIPLANMIDPEAPVLSVRGNINENGMPRFFKRLREGVFDEEDLKFRTEELNEFLDDAAQEYDFNRSDLVAIGYSNGANIAGSLLFHYQDVFQGALLFHPMVPLRGLTLPDMGNTPVFIGAGENDPICSPEETKELKELLEGANSDVTLFWENKGHQLTENEVREATAWYNDHLK